MTPPKLTDEQINLQWFIHSNAKVCASQGFALAIADLVNQQWQEMLAKQEPVAHVLFRQDNDGLEPIMFYGPGTAPDPSSLKDRFTLRDVWLTPVRLHPAPDQAAVMRQALKALEDLVCLAEAAMRESGGYMLEAELQDGRAAIAALKQVLGEQP